MNWECIDQRGIFAQVMLLHVSELTISLDKDSGDACGKAALKRMEDGDYSTLYIAICHILYQGSSSSQVFDPNWRCVRLRVRYAGSPKAPRYLSDTPLGNNSLREVKKKWILEHVTDEDGAHLPEILCRRSLPHTPLPSSGLANTSEDNQEDYNDQVE
jgi:hypothetical protein